MALIELIHTAVPWQGWNTYVNKDVLTLITCVKFGDSIDIVFNSGMTVVLDNLDRALDALTWDFGQSPSYPDLELGRTNGGVLRLELRPLQRNWLKDLTLLDSTIRSMVATYRLSGKWDEDMLRTYRTFGGLAVQLNSGSDEDDRRILPTPER